SKKEVVFVQKGQSAFRVDFNIPPTNPSGEASSFYEIKVLTESGAQKVSLRTSEHDAKNPVDLFLSTRAFAPGNYLMLFQEITAENNKKGEAFKFPFELKFQD